MTGFGERTTGLNSPVPGIALLFLSIATNALGARTAQPGTQTLDTDLAGLVDLLASERDDAAPRLSRHREVTVAQWAAAMARSGSFAPQDPGVQRHQLHLEVLGETEFAERFDRTFLPAFEVVFP